MDALTIIFCSTLTRANVPEGFGVYDLVSSERYDVSALRRVLETGLLVGIDGPTFLDRARKRACHCVIQESDDLAKTLGQAHPEDEPPPRVIAISSGHTSSDVGTPEGAVIATRGFELEKKWIGVCEVSGVLERAITGEELRDDTPAVRP